MQGMPSWMLKYPKITIDIGVGRKIMIWVLVSSVNGGESVEWSVDENGEEARGQNGHLLGVLKVSS